MADKPGGKPAPAPAAPSISMAEIIVAAVLALIIFSVLGTLYSATATEAAVGFFTSVLNFVKLVSTVISMAAIVIVIYSFMRIQEITGEENKKLGLALSWESERNQKNIRWQRVEEYMTSLNPSDWKVAILEADNILDEITTRMGYEGSTLGERMKKIPATDFPYLEEAWEAHKIRNAVAHKGTDYGLSRSDAEHVVNIYYRVFAALGYL
jgi:hypothetical protein